MTTVNNKKKVFQIKGWDRFAVGVRNKQEAVSLFHNFRIGVVKTDLEEIEINVPENTPSIVLDNVTFDKFKESWQT